MTETTQAQRDQAEKSALDRWTTYSAYCEPEALLALSRDADRLARIKQACLIRSEIDAPPEACWWSRDIKGNGEVECVWLDEELDEVPVDGIAPNYPINGAYATFARLPIIDA